MWARLPSRLQFHVKAGEGRTDRYRLREGRLEFCKSGTSDWRALEYPDIEHHLALNTPVARWIGHLYTLGEMARFLSSDL